MRLASVFLFLAACGGTTTDIDASTPDAGDAGTDAPYLACMDSSGQLSSSLKTCQSDADCTIQEEQTDCCGTILFVGVNASSVSAFSACESAWLSHFPACGCDSNQKKTEDGKSISDSDGAAPSVHCTDFTNDGGICLTYQP